MIVPRRIWLGALFVALAFSNLTRAAEPARLAIADPQAPLASASANQKLADLIAEHLRQSGQLRHYSLDVVCKDGVVDVTGNVVDQSQKEEALRLVQGVPGVERVWDHLAVSSAITPVQAQTPAPQTPAPQTPALLPDPLPSNSPAPTLPAPNAGPLPTLPPVGGPGAGAEPVPIFSAPPPATSALNPPRMPPYAWPTYAPYNNYSRVACPTSYPYNAFPFIGPIYPFPKVPLGWRSVKLEWDDGHWWFSKVANPYDWWHLRYF